MDVQEIIDRKIPVIASFSGGKDSVAMCLYLLYESPIPKEQIHIVFADTKWEHKYTYITVLRMASHHPVQMVSNKSYNNEGMPGLLKKFLPTKLNRRCTVDLKVRPLRKYDNSFNCEVVKAKGIRKEEGTHSNGRGDVEEFELDLGSMMYSYYPIRDYTLQDVWDIHDRYNFKRNKLYDLGFSRVGCMPCIFARKNEIKLASEIASKHIDIIREAENNLQYPYFSPSGKTKFHDKVDYNGKPYASIDAIIAWSKLSIKEVRAYTPTDTPTEIDESDTCSSGLCE